MNVNRDADTILAAWIDEGPLALPDETRRAIAVGARTVTQRRPLWRFRRARPADLQDRLLRFGVVVSALALAAAIGFVAWNGRLNDFLPGVPSPLPSPSASLASTAEPVIVPTPTGLAGPGAIAYASEGRIKLVDPVTREQRALSPDLRELVDDRLSTSCGLDGRELTVSEMAWSPDGRILAFVPYAPRDRLKCGVFAVSADGETLRTLLDGVTDVPVTWAGPTILGWSPDGEHVALGHNESIIVASIDGDDTVDLSTPCRECYVERFAKPGWSHDGTMLAARIVMPNTHDPVSVAVVEVGSGRWTWLWPLDGVPSGGAFHPFPQAWLADGAVLVEAGGELFAIDSRDPDEWTSVGSQGSDGVMHQAWKPGLGLFASNTGGDGGLRIQDPVSGEVALPVPWSVWGTPTWAADGSHELAVIRESDWSVWIVSADGSSLQRIAQADAEGSLAWQPIWPEGDQ